MAVCQVNNMDVVTDTGAVRGIIIIAKYAEAYQLADCHLGNIWKKIVRDSLRIFTDTSGFMGSDRVKVTEQHNLPVLICCVKIG